MKHDDPRIRAVLGKLASPALATIDLSLDRVTALLGALGNPHDKLPPVVHVAGTNGKGSLVAYLTAIMQAAGYRVHRYISPHLVRFNERIMLADKDIDDERLLAVLERVAAVSDRHPVTFFEATTAAAFLAFAETSADIVLLETGLGGRLDATNMVRAPALVAITPISMDHTEYLGNTLALIAGEKAAIIKPGAACVVGPQPQEASQVIEAAALAADAPLLRFGREWEAEATISGFRYRLGAGQEVFPLPGLAGAHQINNAATAVACIRELSGFTVTRAHIEQGITRASWPARLQRLSSGSLAALMPQGAELWLDGGHNPGAGEVLAAWVRAQKKPVHLICGMLKTKDSAQFLAPLAPHVRSFTAVAIEGEQGHAPEALAATARASGIQNAIPGHSNHIKKSIESIVKKEGNDLVILICGSLYLAGNILWQNSRDG